ncbi:prolyl oligopeptidase family serine peptidase [Sphingosinicella sp. YJ22]|uniref:prolyl oligopeptidase family serine peptidase n=1 Tax=Sphingosinicella sp. YJ22 TaxID=1104780 RepID=UPI00140BD078|nr:prolyl oligopeptidase family serine peptidase [Sphingosinicella sp. YJ22]
MRRALLCLTALSVAVSPFAVAAQQSSTAAAARIAYPETARENVVDTQFGVAVQDPYRWLENDVRQDPRVRQWVTAQNQVTNAFLAQLPHRDAFRARMRELYDYERFSVPQKAGSRYFYTRNDGLQNQSVLYVRDGLTGAQRQLIDPNSWSQDGATALAEWEPSKDGRYVAYGVQEGGTDWRIIRVLDAATGRVLDDEVRWAKFTGIEWARDGSGFYYSRFPEPTAAQQFQSTNENHAIYFHRIGTPQSEDRLVFAQPDRPRLSNNGEVTDDGRWLIVYSNEGTDARYEITLIDLTQPNAQPRRIVSEAQNDWSYLGNQGTRFYWQTNKDAPRQRVVAMDIANPAALTEIVAEDAATLQGASIVGDRLVLRYLADAKSEVRTFDLTGRRLGTVALPGIGTASGFSGDMSDSETFYSFASFNSPGAIYRYDSRTGESTVFAQPEVAFDPARYEVRQVFYNSKDGTRVPMFLVHRRDLDTSRPQPTLLYGYGGFNAPELPRYQPKWMTWVDMGGVLAVANIRGGGEYGQAWHDAGRLANKQNVFDDFIGAGEYLIREGVTTNRQLAVEGRSNGGLLVGAVVNQRPDLFAAALPTVGVMDMLRFDRFTAGRYWVDDYGYPNREADFRTLYAYSPYHNIRTNVSYPPILVTTADTDDRVVPGHSFKYVAALQNADPNGAPHLIRIETRAGHGSGKPTDKQIEEYSDMYAFIAHFTGMAVPTRRAGERG